MNRTKSQAMLNRASQYIPGGVSSSMRALDFPFFVEHGEGSHIWDVDGNEYIDYVMAYGPLVLGHAPKCVNQAIRAQLAKGLIHGTGTELEYLLAKEIVDLVPGVDQVRFGTTGSESVHMALRLARAHTGRDKIVKFEGHFHGTIAEAYQSVTPTAPMGPACAPWTKRQVAGQLVSNETDVIVQPFNDLSILEKTLKNRGHEIAAIILEPVAAYNGIQTPVPGFITGLRQITEQYGVLLIFDEVVTGFRLALGGAQEYYGVKADITVMAKGLGCGVPLAAIGGSKPVMETITNLTMPHYGTYNAGALCLSGALAGVRKLRSNNGAAIKKMHYLGKKLRTGLNTLFERYDAPLSAQGIDPLFSIVCQPENIPSRHYRDLLLRDYATSRRFRDEMFDTGVWILDRGTCVLSAAHHETDITHTLQIAEEILQQGQWLNRPLGQV